MFSAHRKTILFLGSEPLFAKISLIAMLSALIACGCGCSQNTANDPGVETSAAFNVMDQSVLAPASNNEQVPKPNNIWDDSVWDKAIWTSPLAAQSKDWKNDSWSETLWQ